MILQFFKKSDAGPWFLKEGDILTNCCQPMYNGEISLQWLSL